MHSPLRHSNPRATVLLDEAQRMQLDFQVQQHKAIYYYGLIHKPSQSDIGMVPSESNYGPFCTLILIFSSVLSNQCIEVQPSESSSEML